MDFLSVLAGQIQTTVLYSTISSTCTIGGCKVARLREVFFYSDNVEGVKKNEAYAIRLL